jgi:endonuclease III
MAKLKPPIGEYLRLLKRYYPDSHCALNFSNPFELLVATALSAQCTDVRVNIVTETLFKKYPTPKKLAEADPSELENDIRSINFYRNKARNLKSMATQLMNEHGGRVPSDLDQLVKLAGIGRKTANVVLGNAFRIPSGVVVDTHVGRLSGRLGLTREKTAEKIEIDLQKQVPKEDWIQFSHWLIDHGRQVCKARKPACDKCFLETICPKIL